MIRLLMFLCLLASSLSYAEELGYYIPWMPKKYTYKEYKGKPDIDDPAFEEVRKQKYKTSGCDAWLSKYRDLSMEKLEKLVEENKDVDAIFEMHLRVEDTFRVNKEPLPREKWKYLDMAAKRGHVVANIKVIWADATDKNYLEKLELLEKYAQITPLGRVFKMFIMGKFQDPRFEAETEKLKDVWQYPYVMAFGAMFRYKNSKQSSHVVIDADAFCEAYFHGCIMPKYLNIREYLLIDSFMLYFSLLKGV